MLHVRDPCTSEPYGFHLLEGRYGLETYKCSSPHLLVLYLCRTQSSDMREIQNFKIIKSFFGLEESRGGAEISLAQNLASFLTVFLVWPSVWPDLVALKTKYEDLILVCSWSVTSYLFSA